MSTQNIHTYLARFLLAGAIVALPLTADAQMRTQCTEGPGTLTMELSSDLSATVPSASVGIYASMQNNSAETVNSHVLAVEVVRESDGVIVDRFLAPQKVTIFGNSPAKIGFEWKTPSGLLNGSYTVVATLAPEEASRAKVFAHVGYPSARMSIMISEGRDDALAIRAMQVNGAPYEPWSVAGVSEGSVLAVVTATNGQASPSRGVMAWDLYAAGATLADEPLDSAEEVLELHPGASRDAAYQLPSGQEGAYYIEGRLQDGNGTSYVDVLLDRSGDAFPWTQCLPEAKGGTGSFTYALFAAFAAIIAFGLWMELRTKWK